MSSVVTLVSGDRKSVRDGVQQYANRLYDGLLSSQGHYKFEYVALSRNCFKDFPVLLRCMRKSDIVHVQYPVESWGNTFHQSLFFFIISFFTQDLKLVATMHEWTSLNPLRKLSLAPMLLVVNSIVFVSDKERSNFNCSRSKKFCLSLKMVNLVGIFSNIELSESSVASNLKKYSERGSALTIGYFGFIYSWKMPYRMLELVKELKNRDVRVILKICGDFNLDQRSQKKHFFQKIYEYELADSIVYKGFIENESELSDHLSDVDANILLFQDGLSFRRSSFWFCLDIGRPIITSEIAKGERQLEERLSNLESGRILYLPPDEGVESSADKIQSFLLGTRRGYSTKKSPEYDNVVNMHLNVYNELMQL